MGCAGRLALVGLWLGALSCGSGSSSPCNVKYDCPAGQTCETLDGTTWSCMTSGTDAVGVTCSASAGAAVACGDGLVCLAMGDPAAGTCVAWCDSTIACPAGYSCQTITTTKASTLKLCVACDTFYACPAGQTCGTLDGTTFSCMTSGSGSAGATCNATVGQPVTCGDGLLCLAMGDPTAGVCTNWCDGKACPSGQTCQHATTTNGVTLQFCR